MAKKIAIFTGYCLPHLGGVEQYTFNLSKALVKKGYEVVIISSNYNNDKSYEKDKITFYRLPVFNIFKERYPIFKHNKEYKKILKELRKENIDYCICNTKFYFTSFIAAKFAKKNDLPIVCIDHSSNHLSVGNKVLDIFGKLYEHLLCFILKKKIKEFYGVSQKTNDWLKHFGIEAKGVFYNSIDTDLYEDFKNDTFDKKYDKKVILCFAGRVMKEKGIFNLLDAFEQLEKEYDNISLIIAGDGKDLEEAKRRYKSKNINFLGKINHDEIMKIFNTSDILINPSMYPEGLPTCILEAGLMKNVVLATRRGGTTEIINDKTGILIEENVGSIVTNVKKVLNDKKLMDYYKENIHKEVIENLSWEKTSSKVIEALDKKTTIYVATHKKASFPEEKIYVPIRVGAALNKEDFGYVRDDTKENISFKNKNYCELTATYWIWKNDKSDIVGLTHYRRYFFKKHKRMNFKNVLTKNDIRKILNEYDIIVPNKTFIIKHNVKQSWNKTHIKKDYDLTRDIIKEKYPEYLDAFDKFSKSKTLYICNMFITKKEIFDAYYEWLFDILFELEKRTDISNYDDYNKRLFGFMSERLFNVWLIKNNNLKLKRMPVYNTSKRPYNQKFMIN